MRKNENVKEVLLVGDTHGNFEWISQAVIPVAKAAKVQKILQLGDFGFWPHTAKGRTFLVKLNDLLEEADLDLWWVDGNHENHDWLNAQVHDADGFWQSGRITHASRGARWEWSGKKFVACGGAYSIDKSYRDPGFSWWPGETITREDVNRCIDGDHADIVVSHDAPSEATEAIPSWASLGRQKDLFPESKANRARLSSVVYRVNASLVLHGHYHYRYSQEVLIRGRNSCRVEGFGCDLDWNGAFGLLRLPAAEVFSLSVLPEEQ